MAGFDSIMNGWYNGCEIPQGLKSDEFKKILSDIINNGSITLEDLYIKGSTTVRGLAFRNL